MKAPLLAAAALAVTAALTSSADAQWVTYYSPVVAPAPVVAYHPVAPAPTVVYRPVAPAPTVVYRPAPVVTAVAPAAVVTTRYRPLLGRAVTRVRYRYTPVTYYAY